MSGPLALVGGGAWRDGATFDAGLLRASGGTEVLVVPTAAAYEHPDRLVEQARGWFEGLGATVAALDVHQRHDALDEERAGVAASARFAYLADGSSLHLRSVLKDTPVLDALVRAWEGGAALAACGAAASALCDPMVDPRGGALTVGLGLVAGLAVLPATGPAEAVAEHRRTLELADPGVCVAAIPERTALVRDPDGSWRTDGAGTVTVFRGGDEVGLDALPR